MQRTRWILAAAIAAVLCGSPALVATPATHGPDIGIDLAGIDHAVKPGDNFFDYANGNWLKTAQIPADRSSTGTFLKIFELTEKHTADLIQHAGASHPTAGSNARKIADYYAAYMDEAAIAKHGLAPLKPELSAIDAIASKGDLARVLGSRLRADVDPINATNFHTENLFGLFVTQGLEDPSHTIAYLLQGGLAMPSRDYYLSTDPHMAAFRTQYHAYVVALLKQAGIADAAAKADTVIALETKIAKAQESLIDSQDVHKANNLWTMADFAQKAPGLDWAAYFKAAGLSGQQQIDAWQPAATTGLAALVGSEPLDAWKDLLVFHTLNAAAPLLPKTYADLSFGFYGHTLQGTPQQQPRWKRAVGATNVDLGDAVGQLYVQKYFPASSKAEVQQLVKNLIAAFDERLDTLSWMTPATRAKAKEKLVTLKVGVGYPEKWRDYSTLKISADDPLGNHLRAVKHEYQHQLAKLGQPVDRGEWWMTPQLVKNLIAAFDERLDTLSWMTPATRAKAKEKLVTLKVGVGYPEKWRDYSTLKVSADDPLGNHLRAVKHEYEHQLAKLGQPVDRGEWWMTPQLVNAVNLPLQNALNFPAAILQPPFFDPKADAAANYGAIGAIIGHEISHSFDNTGADFDAQGKMENWWTPADEAHFKSATAQLAKQFDQYEALPGLHVNGEQTLGEDIADVSGLTIAYLAYHKSLDGKSAPVIDGLTGDQRFFLAFGQAWRSKMRDAALRQRLATDVHAPAQFRALTVRNLDAWYPAFNVQPGQKLYLAPDQRVKIW